jgi:AGZA family xanthine/uracil permease-like MFS transporter
VGVVAGRETARVDVGELDRRRLAAGEFDETSVGQWVLAGAFLVYFGVRTSGIVG